jgi:hypothetical protein
MAREREWEGRRAGGEDMPTVIGAQRQALTVSLRVIETDLAWIDTLLACRYRGIMTSFHDDLEQPAHHQLRARIAEAREIIRGLARSLELEPETVRKSRWIIGHLAQLWVVTEECQSPHLRGYGEVAASLSAVVDPAARELGGLLIEMQRIARNGAAAADIPAGARDAQR